MKFKLLVFLGSLALLMNPANAEVQINGFASIVMGVDLEGQDDGNIPREGYGDRTVDNLQESRVALQWSADLGEGLRFVGQTMARGDSNDGFVLGYDWAYFDLNVGDSGKLKFGRVRIPFYKYSDYLDVGYAYHWVTPPPAMYNLSFSNVDGIGYQQNFSNGSLEHSLNMVFGRYQGSLNIGGVPNPGNLENFLAVNWSAAIGDHEFYAAYAQADVYITSDLLWNDVNEDGAIAADGTEGVASSALALSLDSNDVLINGDLGSFVGVGYKGTFGDLSLFAEWSEVVVEDSILGDSSIGYYLGAAYNMGDLTYHITYEAQENDGSTFNGTGLEAVEDGVITEGEASSIIIGLRKDIGMSSAMKVELTSFTEDDKEIPSASNPTGAAVERDALILKVAIETMF